MDNQYLTNSIDPPGFKQLENIFKNSSYGVIIIDHDARIKYLNKSMNNIIHDNTDKYINKPLNKLYISKTEEFRMMEDAHIETIRLYAETEKIKAELEDKNKQLNDLIYNTVNAFVKIMEAKDSFSKGHSINVSKIAMSIARNMELSTDEVKNIAYAGLFHDLGKLRVKEDILNKPEKLSKEEFDIIKQHPAWAVEILSPITEFQNILPNIYHHHEKFNGNGYPDGIKGDKIPVGARILSIAEAFVSMTSDKIYQKAMNVPEALDIISKGSGKDFCPTCCEYFLNLPCNHSLNIH